MIEGCNIFWGQKLANTCRFVAGCIIVQQEKILRAEHSQTDPLNAFQTAIHYSFIKFCIYCFSLWYEFFVQYALRVEKKLSIWSWCRTFGISVSLAEGVSHQTIQDTVALFRGIGKTPGLTSHNNFVKKIVVCIGHCDNVLARCDTQSSLCLGVKECRTKRAHNFLFPKSSFRIQRTTVLGMFKDSAIILDAIQRSFLTKSAMAAMFTSVWINFGWPPLTSSSTSSLLSRIENTT